MQGLTNTHMSCLVQNKAVKGGTSTASRKPACQLSSTLCTARAAQPAKERRPTCPLSSSTSSLIKYPWMRSCALCRLSCALTFALAQDCSAPSNRCSCSNAQSSLKLRRLTPKAPGWSLSACILIGRYRHACVVSPWIEPKRPSRHRHHSRTSRPRSPALTWRIRPSCTSTLFYAVTGSTSNHRLLSNSRAQMMDLGECVTWRRNFNRCFRESCLLCRALRLTCALAMAGTALQTRSAPVCPLLDFVPSRKSTRLSVSETFALRATNERLVRILCWSDTCTASSDASRSSR